MIDLTVPSRLDPSAGWPEPAVDLGFAARAAGYLRDQGLNSDAIVAALCAELDVPACEAIRLARGCQSVRGSESPRRGTRPFTQMTSIVEPITH